MGSSMSDLARLSFARTFSVSAENPTGAKGRGGMATEGFGADSARELGVGWKVSPALTIPAHETVELCNIQNREGAIKHIWMTNLSQINRNLVLRIYWDMHDEPSVEVPLSDFFATADQTDFRPLYSLAVCVTPKNGFNCYWTMPFRKGFRITVENITEKEDLLFYQIDCVETKLPEDSAYFHAQYRQIDAVPEKGCYTILDTVRGKGQYVGTYMFYGPKCNGWWGEGEVKFYLDGDTDFPTICGTGLEDYFCGAFMFEVNNAYMEFATPYTGLSKVSTTDALYQSQKRFSLYRWHVTDPIYFEKEIRITAQALGFRRDRRYLTRQDEISTVAYYYLDHVEKLEPLPSADALEIF
ncbi:MAG: DUF2961 domain-containing protein [Clostridiales bacterium]|nr:DUF2961 domain-containing protein [Clostridiales bacterium]